MRLPHNKKRITSLIGAIYFLLLLWSFDAEVLTNLSTKIVVYFPMSWDGRNLFRLAIHIHSMAAAFAKKFASLPFEVPYKIRSIHAVSVPKGSLTTSFPAFSSS